MELLVLVLNKVELLDDVLSFYVEAGVSGATVIDSVGMGRIIATMPIFAGFRDLMAGNRPSNKTILAAVDSSMVPDLIEGIEKILGNIADPGTGLIFTLPINNLKGMGKGF
jgi:nitrogen regulatory protein PII